MALLLACRLLPILALLALTMAFAMSAAVAKGAGPGGPQAAIATSTGPGGSQAAQQVDDEDPGDDDFDDDLDLEDDLFDDEELLEDDEPVDDEADELAPIEQATAELGRAKRAAASRVAGLGNRSAATLRPCMRGGRGWKRIRAVRHAPQRALYAAAARRLLADMRTLLDVQQPRIEAYGPAFDRYVDQLRAVGVTSPLLGEAIAVQGRRLAAHRDVRAMVANCRVFNRLTSAVREFPTRRAAQIVRADYRATPIARRIERHIASQLAAIDRRRGISHRDVRTLQDAADEMVDAGGSPGAALGFQYALSLR